MLDTNVKNQLTTYVEKLVNPVVIEAAVDGGEKSRDMLALLREIAGLSALITLREVDGAEHRKPSFALRGIDGRASIRFAGIPLGHEFSSLVLALLQVGGHPPKVDADIAAQIAGLPGEYHFESFISLSCQNCPTVVQALNLMAVLNPNISHVMIDGALFPQEVEARGIMAVPSVFLNGEAFGQGRMTLPEILAKLDTGAAARTAEHLSAREPYDMLIVGGGPAGAAAAVYAARKGIRTGLVAERFGGQLLDTVAIENFISVKATEGPQLVAGLEQHVRDYAVDVIADQRAKALLPGELIGVELESGARLQSRAVLIATGARWREMNVPGEREYRGRGVAYCPHCDGPLFQGKRVAVIGGGNSGIEAAIDLAGIAAHVTVREFDPQLRADAVLQRKAKSLPNVTLITQAQTTEVIGDGAKVSALAYRDRATGEQHRLELDGIFVQIGLLPNTDWLRGTLALTARGEIEVDAKGQTDVPGVFAAGDVTTTHYKQIIIAMGGGASAALGAFDYLIRNSAPAAAAA
jgi:alkyl hydroperoxide reductase subunit F